jgi:hypothetical protein
VSRELLFTAPGVVSPADKVPAVAGARAISQGTAVSLYRAASVFPARHGDAGRRRFLPVAQGVADLLQMVHK